MDSTAAIVSSYEFQFKTTMRTLGLPADFTVRGCVAGDDNLNPFRYPKEMRRRRNGD
jgi:hypothetical protein